MQRRARVLSTVAFEGSQSAHGLTGTRTAILNSMSSR
jgi:hypothetical protein